MFVHNEIGVIQDLKSIAKICREKKTFLHTDAAQAVGKPWNILSQILISLKGKIPVDVKDLDIDLMSISGHKVENIIFLSVSYINLALWT